MLTSRNSSFNDFTFPRIKFGKCLVKRKGYATTISMAFAERRIIAQDTTPTRFAKIKTVMSETVATDILRHVDSMQVLEYANGWIPVCTVMT